MSNLKQQLYIPGLTALRGFAACYIVLFHFAEDFGFSYNIGYKGYLAVDFFFILSGFILTHIYASYFSSGFSYTRYKHFLILRLARIYPIHLFSLFLVAAIIIGLKFTGTIPLETKHNTAELISPPSKQIDLPHTQKLTPPEGVSHIEHYIHILNTTPSERKSFLSFGANLLLVQSWGLFNTLTWNSPSWSISAEWLCYLLFPLSLLFINTTSGKQCLIYLFSILMLQGIILINQKSFNLDTTYEYGCLRAYFEFLQGMLLYKLYAAGYNKRYVTSDQAVIYAFIAGFALLLMNTMAESLIVLPMALLIYAVAQNTSATKAFLEYRPIYILGEISLSVYLLQHPVWLVYRNLNNFLLNHTPEQWWWAMACVNLILYFLCLFTLSLGVYRYIEKPMRTFIRARYTKSN